MSEPQSPQRLRFRDYGQHGCNITQASPTPLEYPEHEGHKQPTPPRPPTPPTHYQAAKRRLAAPWHIDDPYLFRVQERECLSRPTAWFRIQIDIDLPDSPQAIGGRCSPPRAFTPHQNLPLYKPQPQPQPQSQSQFLPSPTLHNFTPHQHRSSDGHKMTQTLSHPLNSNHTRGILINPLSGVVGPANKHRLIHQRHEARYRSQHLRPSPEPRYGSPGTIDGNARWHHAPHSGRNSKRAEKTLRRDGD